MSEIVHVSLLLLSVALGVTVLLFFEPTKPPPTEPLYEVMLFQQEHAVSDFSTPLSLMNASKRMNLGGEEQLVTQSSGAALLKQAFAIWKPRMMVISNRTSNQTKKFQIGVEGIVVGGRIVTEFEFVVEGRRTEHHFSLTENKLQLLVLDRGIPSNPQITYALIRAARIPARPKAPRVFILPQQKPKASILIAG